MLMWTILFIIPKPTAFSIGHSHLLIVEYWIYHIHCSTGVELRMVYIIDHRVNGVFIKALYMYFYLPLNHVCHCGVIRRLPCLVWSMICIIVCWRKWKFLPSWLLECGKKEVSGSDARQPSFQSFLKCRGGIWQRSIGHTMVGIEIGLTEYGSSFSNELSFLLRSTAFELISPIICRTGVSKPLR